MAKAVKPAHVMRHAPKAVKRARHNTKAESKKRRGVLATAGEPMTGELWKGVIFNMAHGMNRKECAADLGISIQTIEAYLVSNVGAYKQLRDAQLSHIRSGWSADLLDSIFTDLASGLSLKRAALKNGIENHRMSELYKLVRADKAIREAYDDARELWAESFLDDTIDIADNSTEDRLENGRINHEVVNRSKLRIDARWKAMGAMVKKRFGEHKHVELEGNLQLNHIALLTGARKRLEDRGPKAKPMTTIDNETGEITKT